ncbi:MAG TPA: 1,4-alpha-glucan branching protein GlgB [Chthoniobacteraceae bacterium]|nr:1,4-alpha-glucan branching protein GlgB [Chthoniobacteraceae bacterium]
MTLPTLDQHHLESLLAARHGDPFAVLGLHEAEGHFVVRVFRPDARHVVVEALPPGAEEGKPTRFNAQRLHRNGYFEALIPAGFAAARFDYRLRLLGHDGSQWTIDDPYAFGPQIGAVDAYLFGEGNHHRIYEKLGAHLCEQGGVRGCRFAVWAPNAERVSVVGDFNQWDGRIHPMRKHPSCGIWEIFLPGVEEGTHYKYEIRTWDEAITLKSDPYAFYNQHSQQTASIVFDLHRYQWSDADWMEERDRTEWHRRPVSIYEVHLGSWARIPEEGNRPLSYLEFADRLLDYVCDMGYTHIELMPVAEHPFDGSWGYQVTGYYAPTSRFGDPDEFRHFVDRCHQRGIGVLLDWVPAHFPKDAHGLARFDGTALYEHADPRQGEHTDWGTLIFNYGRNEVRNFLTANALFWLEQYHIDGLRVDAVASMLYLDYSRSSGEWVPNAHGGRENLEAIAFLKQCNELCYNRHPGVMMVAEESTAWPGVSRPTYLGGLGFGFKWNMGWMHDFLVYMQKDPIHRRYHQGDVTFSLLYAFHEHFILVLSHDEVVHGKGSLLGKMPGDTWQKFANLRLFYTWMYAHPGKKLLFQGGEFGQWSEWNYDESLDWHLLDSHFHNGVRRLVKDLNRLYKEEPALWTLDDTHEGFEWIDFHDADNCVLAFLRRGSDGSELIFIVNATPVVREDYRMGMPGPGNYTEVINSDADPYGGTDGYRFPGGEAEAIPSHGRTHSLTLTLPPLAVIGLRRV